MLLGRHAGCLLALASGAGIENEKRQQCAFSVAKAEGQKC